MTATAPKPREPEELLRLPRRDGADVVASVDWEAGVIAFTREGGAEPLFVVTARELPAVRVLFETVSGRRAFRGC